MKKVMFTIILTGFFTGSAIAADSMATEAGKGTGDMGLGAGQSKDQMFATQDQRFQNIDGDQDGYITRKEAENHQRLTSNWDKADVNADGKLDASEFSAFEEIVPPGSGR